MDLITKAGFKGLVMETGAQNAFTVIGYGLSVGLGMACWAWMEGMCVQT